MSLERLRPKHFMSTTGKTYSNKSYTVRISTSDGWYVEGISKNPLNFKLGAKWGDLFNGLIPGAELAQKTGDASFTTGIFSQKYFQGGNNLEMNVEFRIHDDGRNELNPVIEGARRLAGMTLSNPINIKQQTDRIRKTAGRKWEVGKQIGKAVTEGEWRDLGDIVQKEGEDWISAINKRRVTLTIQNLISCNQMAIQDVSVTYSGSQSHSGPLYGDFSVSLISLQALTRGGGDYGIDDILQRRSYRISIDNKTFESSSYSDGFIGPRLPTD